jgi:hypothetical protein
MGTELVQRIYVALWNAHLDCLLLARLLRRDGGGCSGRLRLPGLNLGGDLGRGLLSLLLLQLQQQRKSLCQWMRTNL